MEPFESNFDKGWGAVPTKERLSLVLTRRAYIPDYASPDLISALAERFELSIVVRGRVIRDDVLTELSEPVRVIDFDDDFPDKFRFLADLYTRRYWRRSSSFKVRLLREERWESRGEFLRYLRSSFNSTSISRIVKGKVNRQLLVQASPILFFFTSMWHRLRLPPAKGLEAAIRESNPHLVLIPSNAYGYLDVEAVRVANKLGAKSLLCVDNWDNMSSKAVLIRRPNAIAVVGEQSAQHAIRIHRFPEKRIFSIGAPRFDSYSPNNVARQPPIKVPYIFVAGYSQPFDEIGLVRFVSQVVKESPSVNRSAPMVVYRPHPWKPRDLSEIQELQNVIVDDPFQGSPYLDLATVTAWMFHARAVIGAPTTLLLEALLMEKRVAVAAIEDSSVLVGPQIEFDSYTHFKELSDVKGVTICRNLSTLKNYILTSLHDGFIETESRGLTVDFLITRDEAGYAKRLVGALDSLKEL